MVLMVSLLTLAVQKNAIAKIPKVKFAEGTGAFSGYRNAITRPTLATLNDGNDSPHTNNQELVIMPTVKRLCLKDVTLK